MKKFILFTLVLTVPLLADTTIPVTTYPPAAPVVVTDPANITTGTSTVTVAPLATVIYQAGTSVKLEPGFTATKGANFFVAIGPTVDTDGDGIPDVWERAYGLNPNNPADANALAADGSGLTNLQEYLANTSPIVFQGLSMGVLPTGFQVILPTPLKRFYGLKTIDWSVTPVAAP